MPFRILMGLCLSLATFTSADAVYGTPQNKDAVTTLWMFLLEFSPLA